MKKSFSSQVYQLLQNIPRGRVTTYKALAHALHSRAYRAVGSSLKHNPFPGESFPCHRVVCSDGSIGQYNGGVKKKIELLKSEGVLVDDGKIVNFSKLCFSFS